MQKTIYRTLPYVGNEQNVLDKWKDILDSRVFVMGKYTDRFEKVFADAVGSSDGAVAVNSCATALYIALKTMHSTDENRIWTPMKVIVPTNTFIATVNAVILAGYEPVFCDVDEDDMCMNMRTMMEAVALVGVDNVAAVIPVHIAGYITPDIHRMCEYCKKNNITIIEDCAHAFGSTRDGIHAGMFGDIGCFSLFATKIITSGEGGVIVSKDRATLIKAAIYRNHGMIKRIHPVDPVLDAGVEAMYASLNYRTTEMCAALGLSQIEDFAHISDARKKISHVYHQALGDVVDLPPSDCNYLYWHYIVKLKKDSGKDRDSVCLSLWQYYGIQTANIYKPACHEQDLYSKFVINGQKFAGYHGAMDRLLSIPMHANLSDEDIKTVIKAMTKVLEFPR